MPLYRLSHNMWLYQRVFTIIINKVPNTQTNIILFYNRYRLNGYILPIMYHLDTYLTNCHNQLTLKKTKHLTSCILSSIINYAIIWVFWITVKVTLSGTVTHYVVNVTLSNIIVHYSFKIVLNPQISQECPCNIILKSTIHALY